MSTQHSQITGSESSGVCTTPGVPVKSEIFDTNVSVGVHSMAQGGYILPAGAHGLMPTEQVASMAMGTYSQTQVGNMPSSSQGLMLPNQATSGYANVSGLPSQTSGSLLLVGVQGSVPSYTGIPAPQGMINNVQPNTSTSVPNAQIVNPNMVSYATTATMPQSGYLPVNGMGAIPSMLPSTVGTPLPRLSTV